MGNAERPRVLIVDDDPTMALLAERMLRRRYEVTVVHEYDAALAQATTEPYALVLCDLQLGARDGIELAAAVQARVPNARFAFVTGSVSAAERGALGVPCLGKPYDLQRLQAFVADALD